MASVQKYRAGYSVRYWYESETGERKMKRVSGFRTKEDAWAAAKELEQKSAAGITNDRSHRALSDAEATAKLIIASMDKIH